MVFDGSVGEAAWNEHNDYPTARPPIVMTDYTTVSIPKDLADRVEETIEGTSFQSTSDLVRFLLRSIVIQHQKQGELTEAQFDEIAEQLRDLGYLG
jgi:Arc/MetJ-type ribon-helix-helix transcriptional regulator